jgi:hypothetical protein
MMSPAPVDAAVTELFLAAVTPAQVDVAFRALDAYEAEQAESRRQRQLQVRQADYEVEIARRRYEAADPANRLVAAELETRWERALQERERLTREAELRDRQAAVPLGTAERRSVRELSVDLGAVWSSATTTVADRKELLRFLVHRVYLDGVAEAGRIRIEVEWHTGSRTLVTVPRPVAGTQAPRKPSAAVERIRALVSRHEYAAVADPLNAEGYRTANGHQFDYESVA